MEGGGMGNPGAKLSRQQFFVQVALENMQLINNGTFMPGGASRRLQNRMMRRCKEVDILRVPDLRRLREEFWSRYRPPVPERRPLCRVENMDCCTAARRLADRGKPLLMNFADPYTPGGGYLIGAAAQEEDICRRTTLYASLSHQEAYEVYRLNRILHRPADTGCMIWSPNVYIFRDDMLRRTEDIAEISVLSLPAPNLNGAAAQMRPEEVERVMLRRMENFFMKAAAEGCRLLVLGAWGCGVFGHDPHRVADCFYRTLFEKGLGAFFQEIVFAVLDHTPEQRNFRAFAEKFSG
ncbi:MAG TPA: TIGR02452 family protein [Firmicutes bacterium]|nr:TIGR02452 family protein [Bacillota bacterium]